jgi:hypothetical protein
VSDFTDLRKKKEADTDLLSSDSHSTATLDRTGDTVIFDPLSE